MKTGPDASLSFSGCEGGAVNENGRAHGTESSRGHSEAAGKITALRADFVMKPEAAGQIQTGIEVTIRGMKDHEDGFLHGVVLVSDQEARLGTLITFWHAREFEETKHRKIRWMQRILKPYLDRCLRMQTQCTYFLNDERGANLEDSDALHRRDRSQLEREEAVCAT
jgi:hypothetical protein